MAIQVAHDVSPSKLVDASHRAGLGQYEQELRRFEEGVRQFDEQQGLRSADLQQRGQLGLLGLAANDLASRRAADASVRRAEIAGMASMYGADADVRQEYVGGLADYYQQGVQSAGGVAEAELRLRQQEAQARGLVDQQRERGQMEIRVANAAAERELQKLAQREMQLNQWAAEGRYRPQEIELARRQIDEQRLGLRAGAIPPPEPEDPADQMRRQMQESVYWTGGEEGAGTPMVFEEGVPQVMRGWRPQSAGPDPVEVERLNYERDKDARELAAKLFAQTGPNGEPRIGSYAEALREALSAPAPAAREPRPGTPGGEGEAPAMTAFSAAAIVEGELGVDVRAFPDGTRERRAANAMVNIVSQFGRDRRGWPPEAARAFDDALAALRGEI